MIRLSWLLVLLSYLVQRTFGHTKVVCAKLIVDANNRPISCEGDQATGSHYVGMIGRENTEDNHSTRDHTCTQPMTGDPKPVECFENRRARICTGAPPNMDRIAKVKPGEKINVAWTLNNHYGDTVRFFYEGRNAPLDQKEPFLFDWINQAQFIGARQFQPLAGSDDIPDFVPTDGTTCMNYNLGDEWYDLANQYDPRSSQNRTCWASITVPVDAPPGLNRILQYWWNSPTYIHFADCVWLWVEGSPEGDFKRDPSPVPDSYLYKTPGITSNPVSDASYYLGEHGTTTESLEWRPVKIGNSPSAGPYQFPVEWPTFDGKPAALAKKINATSSPTPNSPSNNPPPNTAPENQAPNTPTPNPPSSNPPPNTPPENSPPTPPPNSNSGGGETCEDYRERCKAFSPLMDKQGECEHKFQDCKAKPFGPLTARETFGVLPPVGGAPSSQNAPPSDQTPPPTPNSEPTSQAPVNNTPTLLNEVETKKEKKKKKKAKSSEKENVSVSELGPEVIQKLEGLVHTMSMERIQHAMEEMDTLMANMLRGM